jgi:hypothetical protein
MKRKGPTQSDNMRAEYNFDYTKAFRDSASVNAVLRSLLEVSEATRRLTTRSK